jgi:segregation and condensation protein A
MTPEYKVELDGFAGPLDLLLFLVRKEEVAIEALPLARITEQFLRFVESIPAVDIDRAGDYLVMAAQLVEWKARALLPAAPETAQSAEEEARARSELVSDLLEYRALKERARLLESKAEEAARRFGRTSPRTYEDAPTLKNVDLWDLVTAFQRLEKEIGALAPTRVVAEDDAPLHVFVDRVRERLAAARAEGRGERFRALFGDAPTRGELVATFLALLELIRLGEVHARQGAAFDEIEIAPTGALGTGRAAPAPGESLS